MAEINDEVIDYMSSRGLNEIKRCNYDSSVVVNPLHI